MVHFITIESHHQRPDKAFEPLVDFVGVSKQQDQRCQELQQGDCDEGGCPGRRETHKRHEGDGLKVDKKEKETHKDLKIQEPLSGTAATLTVAGQALAVRAIDFV